MAGTRNLYSLAGGDENTGEVREDWLIAVNAIVADNADPEMQHRVRVTIPDLDEAQIVDKWCRALVWWTGPPGFGSYHLPDVGSEVVLFGMKGEDHHLYYAPVFNEDYLVPPAFGPTTKGYATALNYLRQILLNDDTQVGVNKTVEVGGNYSLTVGGTIEMTAGGVLTITASQINLNGAVVNVNSPGGLFVNGVKVTVP